MLSRGLAFLADGVARHPGQRVLVVSHGGWKKIVLEHLSGGEQRRVLLAGLLARRLDVVILDEPLAGLDSEGRERLRAAVHRFLASRTAVVVVSHEPDWAPDLVHQRIRLDQGRVAEVER